MKRVDKEEIIARMERLQPGQRLTFQLTPTFGSQFVILELNPAFPAKGEKKYILRVAKTEERARINAPYDSSDKPKKLAAWVAERWPQWVDSTPPQQEAA